MVKRGRPWALCLFLHISAESKRRKINPQHRNDGALHGQTTPRGRSVFDESSQSHFDDRDLRRSEEARMEDDQAKPLPLRNKGALTRRDILQRTGWIVAVAAIPPVVE